MEPNEIIKAVIAKLDYIKALPVDELETGLDEVQLKIVDLRDRTIEKLRRQENPDQRRLLQQLNLALSLIFGLEYPVTGFQRNKIQQTRDVLQRLAA